MKILAIESSCDETACAVVENGRQVLSSVIHTQIEEHRLYGGVVPEIASRRHMEHIVPVCQAALSQAGLALSQLDAVAPTYAPGLIGALLVGVNFAKGLSLATGLPLIPVHHIRGHIAANYLAFPELAPPFLSLVVSGGHTQIVHVRSYTEFTIIGRTRDDAAGEAFDKVARAMGLPYPGGVYLDKAARKGNPSTYPFPHPQVDGSPLDFSFSGLKTAALNFIHKQNQRGEPFSLENLAASLEATVADILVTHTVTAAKQLGMRKIALAGGVSANTGLRNHFLAASKKENFSLFLPPLSLCGDNAAMIGSQAYYEAQAGHYGDLSLNASASLPLSQKGDFFCTKL